MTNRPLILGCVLLTAGLLTGCGQAPDSSSNAKYGATLDPGILGDPASYQPTKAPGLDTPFTPSSGRGGTAAPSAAAADSSAGGDIQTEAQVVVNDLVGFITDGEAALAIQLFNPEQVLQLQGAPLDALLNTFDVMDRLGRAVEAKLGREQAAPVLRELRGIGAESPTIDVLDPDHATVKPNVARTLFGQTQTGENLALARQDGRWRFQLAAPLSAEDVSNIVIYLDTLQGTLNKITDWVEAANSVTADQLQGFFKQALAGEPVELGAAPAPAESTETPANPRRSSRVRQAP